METTLLSHPKWQEEKKKQHILFRAWFIYRCGFLSVLCGTVTEAFGIYVITQGHAIFQFNTYATVF